MGEFKKCFSWKKGGKAVEVGPAAPQGEGREDLAVHLPRAICLWAATRHCRSTGLGDSSCRW